MSAKGGHVAAGVLTTAVVAFVGLCMASGRSIVSLKTTSPLPAPWSYPYGIGVLSDQFGYSWADGDSLTGNFQCDEHQYRGRYLAAASFMVMASSFIAVLVHAMGAYQGKGWQGLAGLALQAFNLVFLTTALGVGANLYDECFYCSKLPTKVCLKEHFHLNFAVPFLVVGILASLISLIALFAAGSLQGVPEEEPVGETEPAAES